MKRLLGIGLIAAMVMVGANTAQALTWMVSFNRTQGVTAETAASYAPSAGYNPSTDFAAAAGAIDATGKWNVFNPDTRDNAGTMSGIDQTFRYGVNVYNGVAYNNTASGAQLFSVDGGATAYWKITAGGDMWLPRYDVNPLDTDLGKLRGSGGDGKGIGHNDSPVDFTIQLAGLTAGNTFNAYMFGFAGNNADTVNLNLNGGTPVSWNNTGAYTTRGGLVSGTVQGDGTVTLRVTDTIGFFSSGLVFDSYSASGDVPEPGTIVLLGSLLGLGTLGGLRKRFLGAKKSVVA